MDERFQRTDATGSYSYLTDALGSTEALTTSTGAEQATYTYSPYGAFSINGSTTNSYDYTGRESDGIGLEYFRARYYNPNIGRFISEDPAGFAGSGPDLYQYAGDDPIDFTDPFGLDRGPGGGGSRGGNGSCGGGVWACSSLDPNDPFDPFDPIDPFEPNSPFDPDNPTAPSNIFGVTPQQQKACQDAWNNSTVGKGVQFLSLYNLATNLTSLKTWAEWTALPALKIGAFAALSKISSAIGGTELSSVVTGATTTVTAAPVASGVATAESFGAAAAPLAIAGATIADMNVSGTCSGALAPYPGGIDWNAGDLP